MWIWWSFEDGVTNDGTALFKTVKAFKVAFFFSTSVELKKKGAGGGGAGREVCICVFVCGTYVFVEDRNTFRSFLTG